MYRDKARQESFISKHFSTQFYHHRGLLETRSLADLSDKATAMKQNRNSISGNISWIK
jgi:hypothetical protein